MKKIISGVPFGESVNPSSGWTDFMIGSVILYIMGLVGIALQFFMPGLIMAAAGIPGTIWACMLFARLLSGSASNYLGDFR